MEFADWNSQNKIAYGRANGQSSAVTSGKTDTMVYHTGTGGSKISDGAAACQYRSIENLWGNVLQWVDGFNANGTTYIPDYMWSSSGWCVLSVGGYWNYGAPAGLLCFHASYTSSYSYSIISARLLCEA